MFIEIALAVAVGIVLGVLILRYWEPLAIAAICIGAVVLAVVVVAGLGIAAFIALKMYVPTMSTELATAQAKRGKYKLPILRGCARGRAAQASSA
jgi:predicted lysophospholipase L1 biosynthesis ABC-type transport system permease subunit